MLFSRGCAYAIRAVLLVSLKSKRERRKFIPIRELADELNLSFHFLTKILQSLTEAQVLESFRGPRGGVGLARPAEQLTILDIIAAVDGLSIFTECALGLDGCGEQAPCPLHKSWSKGRQALRSMLEKTTLASLTKEIAGNNLRK